MGQKRQTIYDVQSEYASMSTRKSDIDEHFQGKFSKKYLANYQTINDYIFLNLNYEGPYEKL